MPTVNFMSAKGEAWSVLAEQGSSVMETARANQIPGIIADCGGSMSCATCHVYIRQDWIDRVGRASGDEVEMLELAIEPQDNSRLSCQVIIDEALDGLTVEIPAAQF